MDDSMRDAHAVSMGLALFDFLPSMLFFAASIALAAFMSGANERPEAAMLACGASIAFLAGVLKASSKVADAAAHRPVSETGFLYDQMMPSMAVGFLAMAAACFLFATGFSAPWALGAAAHALALLLYAAALWLAAATNRSPGRSRSRLAAAKKLGLIAMVAFELTTLAILITLAVSKKAWASCALFAASAAATLGMGALGSPSIQARLPDRIGANRLEQSVNSLSQGLFLAAALLL